MYFLERKRNIVHPIWLSSLHCTYTLPCNRVQNTCALMQSCACALSCALCSWPHACVSKWRRWCRHVAAFMLPIALIWKTLHVRGMLIIQEESHTNASMRRNDGVLMLLATSYHLPTSLATAIILKQPSNTPATSKISTCIKSFSIVPDNHLYPPPGGIMFSAVPSVRPSVTIYPTRFVDTTSTLLGDRTWFIWKPRHWNLASSRSRVDRAKKRAFCATPKLTKKILP